MQLLILISNTSTTRVHIHPSQGVLQVPECRKWVLTFASCKSGTVDGGPGGPDFIQIQSSVKMSSIWVEFAAHSVSPLTRSQSFTQSCEHSDPVVPEWFTLSVFRCRSLSKHPGALSQAVKLFCVLTNKPSSLTARKTWSHSTKMTCSSVVFKRGVMGSTVPTRRTGSFHYPLLQKGPITEAITPSRDSTNDELESHRAAAQHRYHLTSHFEVANLIPFEMWALIAVCVYMGFTVNRLHLSVVRGCLCTHQMLCKWMQCVDV